jgi:hypothetical protein
MMYAFALSQMVLYITNDEIVIGPIVPGPNCPMSYADPAAPFITCVKIPAVDGSVALPDLNLVVGSGTVSVYVGLYIRLVINVPGVTPPHKPDNPEGNFAEYCVTPDRISVVPVSKPAFAGAIAKIVSDTSSTASAIFVSLVQ